jgi:hypothetical protein
MQLQEDAMTRRMTVAAMVLAVFGAGAVPAEAKSPSLRGLPAQMVEQNQVAKSHGLAFYRTSAEIHEALASGALVELRGNENYDVADFVRHPYAHPVAALFVERLSAQYREACGQKLVVTSAVRPSNGQPRNSHALSVHPAGMALDLRVSDRASCRSWLENALMGMERRGVLNGIRERHPPHYHVAVYPEQYLAYAAERMQHEPAPEYPVSDDVVHALGPEVAEVLVAQQAELVEPSSLPLARRIKFAAAVTLVLAAPLGGQMLRGRRRGDRLGSE